MASGGYRAGAGRKPGAKDKKPRKNSAKTAAQEEKQKIREMLSYDIKAKAKIYSDFLSRLGDKTGTLKALTIAEKKLMKQLGEELSAGLNEDEKTEANAENLNPLDYMLKVMNDPTAEKERRDRMAIASAPFIHARAGEGKGKKDEKEERAKLASQGKFSPSKPPLRMVK